MDDLKNIIKNLDWNMPKELQVEAKQILIENDDWDIESWHHNTRVCQLQNLVDIISAKQYSQQICAVSGLLKLLQDINWPGALKAEELLKMFKKKDILLPLEDALFEAYKTDDSEWVTWLKPLI